MRWFNDTCVFDVQVKEEMLFEALTTRKTVTVGERLIVPYKLAEVRPLFHYRPQTLLQTFCKLFRETDVGFCEVCGLECGVLRVFPVSCLLLNAPLSPHCHLVSLSPSTHTRSLFSTSFVLSVQTQLCAFYVDRLIVH